MKPAFQKSKERPIQKYVGVLKRRGLRCDDLVDAMRGKHKPSSPKP